MQKPSNFILFFCISTIFLTLLCPPYYWNFNHNVAGFGFGFIFTGPFDARFVTRARVDIPVLLTLWGGILLIGALASQIKFDFIKVIQKRIDQFITDVKAKSTRIIVVCCLILFLGVSGYYLNQMIVNGCFSGNTAPKFKFDPADKRVGTNKKPLDFSAYGTRVEPDEKPLDFSAFSTPVEPEEKPLDFSAYGTRVEPGTENKKYGSKPRFGTPETLVK